MKESTYRRKQYYALNPEQNWEDSHENFEIIEEYDRDAVVHHATRYFSHGDTYRYFPGAARAVAVCVAYLVHRHFGEDFYETLDDPDLMNGNDKYFKTYSEDREVYDRIIEQMPEELDFSNYRMSLTYNIVMKEYMLDKEGLKLIPRNRSLDT